jgi:hypothetical protein
MRADTQQLRLVPAEDHKDNLKLRIREPAIAAARNSRWPSTILRTVI